MSDMPAQLDGKRAELDGTISAAAGAGNLGLGARDSGLDAEDDLPTRRRTPLAHALEPAAIYLTGAAIVVVVTGGHANVPARSNHPRGDALAAARALRCHSLVIDSEAASEATGRPRERARAPGGRHVRLADLDGTSVIHLIRTLDQRHDRTPRDT